jgi:hypothetical protein
MVSSSLDDLGDLGDLGDLDDLDDVALDEQKMPATRRL